MAHTSRTSDRSAGGAAQLGKSIHRQDLLVPTNTRWKETGSLKPEPTVTREEIRASYPPWKARFDLVGGLWNYVAARRLSFWVTPWFVRLGFTNYPVEPEQLLSAVPLDRVLMSPNEAKVLTEQVRRPR